jgi:DNA polymerase-3 subunit beta
VSISFVTWHGELTRALDTMRTILGNRPSFPAAGLVRLGVTGIRRDVAIEATNGESYVYAKLPIDDSDANDGLPGQVLVRRALLAVVVKALGDGSTKTKLARAPIHVQEDGGQVALTSADGYRFTLPIEKDVEPLPMPEHQVDELVFVDRTAMLSAVTRLQVCAGTDETLPMLTGIYMKTDPGVGITMAATDRFRLGVTCVRMTPSHDFKIDLLVPADKLAAACRLLPAGEELQVGVGNGLVWLMNFGVSIALRPVDAEFVKYQSLLPKRSAEHRDVIVPRKDLLSAMRRAAAITDRGHHARIAVEGSKVQVTAGGDEGRMESPDFTAEREDADQPPLLIAFNPQYLAPALASFSTDSVAIRYSTPARPFLIAEPGQLDDERAFRTLIMPARLPG